MIVVPTMHPRMRHIAIKYHCFHLYVRNGHIHIIWISTNDQLAGIFPMPLPLSKFIGLRKILLRQ